MFSLTTLVLAYGVVSSVSASSCCDDYWTSYGGRCYRFFESKKDWGEAEAECWYGHGAHLVGINSAQENDFVSYLIQGQHGNSNDPVHIGYNDQGQEGTWRNADQSDASYSSWYSGEPNNSNNNEDCANTMYISRGKWNDEKCSDNGLYYVCEKGGK